MLKECVEAGEIASADIEREMSLNHVRHDAPKLLDRCPSVDEVLSLVRAAAQRAGSSRKNRTPGRFVAP